MLEEVLRYINNRFDADSKGVPYGSVDGALKVENSTIVVDSAKDGQYFWVEGSALNDGLHKYPDTSMADEEFDGRVVLLVVPKAVADLADEIEAWCSANASVIDSPYQSESFGGYSYSKGGGASDGSTAPAAAWQLQYGARLRPYRKLSRDWV